MSRIDITEYSSQALPEGRAELAYQLWTTCNEILREYGTGCGTAQRVSYTRYTQGPITISREACSSGLIISVEIEGLEESRGEWTDCPGELVCRIKRDDSTESISPDVLRPGRWVKCVEEFGALAESARLERESEVERRRKAFDEWRMAEVDDSAVFHTTGVFKAVF